jgi:hypothetical protein
VQSKIFSAVLAAVAMTACGGSQSSLDDGPDPKSMREKESEVTEEEMNEVMSEKIPFDDEFGERVLKRGARKAQECNAMDAPTGEGEVVVVFDGAKGRIVDVELSFAYTDAGDNAQKCLKNAFIGENVPPFDGSKKITYTINIPEKGAKKEEK